MSNIICLSGRKQSGKNTAFNFLLGIIMQNLGIVRGSTTVDRKGDEGKLFISDIFGDEEFSGIFDVDRNSDGMRDFRDEYIYPFIRNFSFADILKRDVCINILGLEWEQCYGTDDQKMTKTHLKWEDMPGNVKAGIDYTDSTNSPYCTLEPKKTGPMTGRDVMQYVGTEIFRKMYGNVWSESTMRAIKNYSSAVSVITDCRFPNEVEAVHKYGGKVIRLTRNPFPEESHDSETALDQDNYDWEKFDLIIDNENMSINEQNDVLYQYLLEIGVFKEIEITE